MRRANVIDDYLSDTSLPSETHRGVTHCPLPAVALDTHAVSLEEIVHPAKTGLSCQSRTNQVPEANVAVDVTTRGLLDDPEDTGRPLLAALALGKLTEQRLQLGPQRFILLAGENFRFSSRSRSHSRILDRIRYARMSEQHLSWLARESIRAYGY